jgi:hypothetical protein
MENDYFYNLEKTGGTSKARNRLKAGFITEEEYQQTLAMWRETTKATPEERLRLVGLLRSQDEVVRERIAEFYQRHHPNRKTGPRPQHTNAEAEAAVEWFNKRHGWTGRPKKNIDQLTTTNLSYRIKLWRKAMKEAEAWLNEVD